MMAFIPLSPIWRCASIRTRAMQRRCTKTVRRLPVRAEVVIDPESQPLYDTLDKPPRIALTREVGKNEALREALEDMYSFIEVMELPCVRTVLLPGAMDLPHRLRNYSRPGAGERIDWVVITSPEAATVFINAWREAGCPRLPRLAAVGRATGDFLRAVGLDVAFAPSKAIGKMLVKEFPDPRTATSCTPDGVENDDNDDSDTNAVSSAAQRSVVLYPASANASGDVEAGLANRGYIVERLNTYSTEIEHFQESFLELAEGVHIVTFASPSAVKGWVQNVGVSPDITVACIGETSARASKEAGFTQVHYPDAPGLDGWITAVCEAMKVYESKHKTSDYVWQNSSNI